MQQLDAVKRFVVFLAAYGALVGAAMAGIAAIALFLVAPLLR